MTKIDEIMTSQNAKIVLFLSLIATMILPFSGMNMAEATPNENIIDKEKSTKTDETLKNKRLKI